MGNAQIADHLDLKSQLPPFVAEVVCALGANPIDSAPALGPPGGELHHESLDTPVTLRYAASSRSGVWECKGTFNVRLVCREGSLKGQKQQVSRSVFAG